MKKLQLFLISFCCVFSLSAFAVTESVDDAVESTKEAAGEAWDKTKEVSGEAWGKTKEMTGDAVSATKEKANELMDSDSGSDDNMDAMKDKAEEGKEKAGELIGSEGSDVNMDDMKQKAEEGKEKAENEMKKLTY